MLEFEKNIPERCRDCQLTCALAKHLKRDREIKERVSDQAMSSMPDEFASEISEHLAAFGVPTPDTARMSEDMRKSAADFLNFLDKRDAELEQFGNDLVLGCRGLLRLRAERDGITYTVAVCTSPLAPNGNSIEPIAIHRTNS